MASARGPAERAILRLSGARTRELVESLCTRRGGESALLLRGREALKGWLDDGTSLLPVDLLWMPGPRSFTAEDVAELHLPGHPELVELVLQRVLTAGARLAQPGEFTRRAFENGRIDLTQAEGVAALVASQSAAERRAAAALLVGGLEARIRGIRDDLERVRALSEASLDFDEADTGHVPTDALVQMTEQAIVRLAEARGWERQRTAEVAAFDVVLAGAPNSGKSTLFNRLVDEASMEAAGPALVSDLVGTTRDAKRGDWSLGGGLTAALFDVAGLGEAAPVDSEPD
ncbi:MAG: GTPase, partial [Planctomycetota bacterium]